MLTITKYRHDMLYISTYMNDLEWVNYRHLLYFWMVAREGGLVAAGNVLRLSHPTLSTQIRCLEEQLDEKLFRKIGRKLELTESGRIVFRYAEEIFTLGREMVDTIKGRSSGQPLRLEVGVTDVVPKLVVRQLLEPALGLAEPVRIACYEDSYEKLLADLALHTVDVVISDAPVPTGSSIRAFNHPLGETTVSFFGTAELAKKYKRGFPASLNQAPMLLPLENLTLRRSLNPWFDRHGIQPRVVGEFEDSALLKVFGSDGIGVFPAPTIVEKEVISQYGVKKLGRAEGVHERFYAISVERRLKHPAVVAISEAARHKFLAKGARRRSSSQT